MTKTKAAKRAAARAARREIRFWIVALCLIAGWLIIKGVA